MSLRKRLGHDGGDDADDPTSADGASGGVPSESSREGLAERLAAGAGGPRRSEPPVTVLDHLGNVHEVDRRDWRSRILPQQLERAWNVPEALVDCIVAALEAGASRELVEAAEHLRDIDPLGERSLILQARVLRACEQFEPAERMLQGYLDSGATTPDALLELARVRQERGQGGVIDDLLRQALSGDPSLEPAVAMLVERAARAGGPAAARAVLEPLAAQGAPLAAAYLAQLDLESGDLEAAVRGYGTALAAAHDDAAGAVLRRLVEDLVGHGCPREALRLAFDRYDPVSHGASVGIALLRGALDTDALDQADRLLHRVMSVTDGGVERQELLEISQQIRQRRNMYDLPEPQDPGAAIEVHVVSMKEPLWYHGLSDPEWMMEDRFSRSVRVGFVPLAKVRTDDVDQPMIERSDMVSRMTRDLPAVLSELVRFGTDAQTFLVVPCVVGVGPMSWTDQLEPSQLRQLTEHENQPADYVVTGEAIPDEDGGFTIRLDVLDATCETRIFEVSESATQEDLGNLVAELRDGLIFGFTQFTSVQSEAPPSWYECPPDGPPLTHYAGATGELLQMLLCKSGAMPLSNLSGQRESLQWMVEIAGNLPGNQAALAVFIAGLALDQQIGSVVHQEFEMVAQRLLSLEFERDPQSAASRLVPVMLAAFGEQDELREWMEDPRGGATTYGHWLRSLAA